MLSHTSLSEWCHNVLWCSRSSPNVHDLAVEFQGIPRTVMPPSFPLSMLSILFMVHHLKEPSRAKFSNTAVRFRNYVNREPEVPIWCCIKNRIKNERRWQSPLSIILLNLYLDLVTTLTEPLVSVMIMRYIEATETNTIILFWRVSSKYQQESNHCWASA